MTRMLRPLVVFAGLLLAWEMLSRAAALPPFILPPPSSVLATLAARHELLLQHAAVTLAEILLGLVFGIALGGASALLLAASTRARSWLLPLVVASQAVPVFALAPLLVLWLGYGMASKVAMAVLVIFFPVTAAFWDGLRRTEPGWLDLARVMGASPGAVLLRIRLPAALPALASGIRVAAGVAPIGAVIGEWVGSGAGLGYLMLHANARMQIDLLFAALLVLATLAVAIYALADWALRRALPWQPDLERSST
jgi:putative hydroxymethylpyrimidine transport system permease protein